MMWKDVLSFNGRERKGIFVLAVLLLLLIILPRWWQSDSQQTFTPDPRLDSLSASLRQSSSPQQRNYRPQERPETEVETTPAGTAFPFNPNEADEATLLALGLAPRTVKSILNYRRAGGKFRRAEDFAKIYTLPEEDYQRLLPFITLPEGDAKTTKKEAEPAVAVSGGLKPFAFDPNTVSVGDLLAMGVSEKGANGIARYREKGGRFFHAKDLEKMYSLSEEEIEALLPFVELPAATEAAAGTKPKEQTQYEKTKSVIDIKPININTASPADWEALPGIGPYFAKKITGFQQALGGFVSVEQVKETYNLPDSVFQRIRPHLLCPEYAVRQINLNTATQEELEKHPYLDRSHAKAILQHRERKGLFKSVESLQILDAFDDGKQTYQKAKPYLTVN